MSLKSWLSEERGRATALAERLGVSLSRVSQMADDGVPPKYMLIVRDFTGGAVTLESMVEARTPDPAEKEAEHG
jgi:DNA-binding transcriptional regulator YdaS (Cro superfamily)